MNAKEKLMQLLELCIEKGLDYDLSNGTIGINRWVSDSNWLFRERVWFNSDENKNINLLNDLITKVKNYQP